MKRTTNRLSLARQTIRTLSSKDLGRAGGGSLLYNYNWQPIQYVEADLDGEAYAIDSQSKTLTGTQGSYFGCTK